ncbi:Probable signal peptidase complex subunit 1 [Trichuris trichiura]|uniref:Signal peptidase complex subunit 1 n=1 Tax=Trichuris trichiura TaxID=36087 RepID=A0A077Z2V5_TRITR|nr:Probable signal peptidase complex subunit 1 [Trichuris trichiura]
MMSFLVSNLPKFSTHIDFVGQAKAERTYQVVLVIAGVIGFVVGYSMQQFSITIYTTLAGFLLACMLVLPPWPFLRRHPVACTLSQMQVVYRCKKRKE